MYNRIMNDISNNHTLIDFALSDDFPSLSLTDKFAAVGSCFSDEMSGRLAADGMDVCVNPFGTMYNPLSIADTVTICLSDRMFDRADVLEYDGNCFTPYHSTLYDCQNADALLSDVNAALQVSRVIMRQSNVFLITYGTSSVWEYSGIPMANCHKVPQKCFSHRMLHTSEIAAAAKSVIDSVRQHSTDSRIIFTISPVRHKNPDLITNSYSKALLRVGLAEAIAECGDSRVMYFPSFEIVMDQLRDYAHYADDGVHLTRHAADYIYDVFLQTCFEPETVSAVHRIRRLCKTMYHRTGRCDQQYYDNLNSVRSELNAMRQQYDTQRLKIMCDEIIKETI